MIVNKPILPSLLITLSLVTILTSGCTTLRNRRDLYFPQKVQGPYTRMTEHGIPRPTPVQGQVMQTTSDGKRVIKPQG
jgi:hypothetical protein